MKKLIFILAGLFVFTLIQAQTAFRKSDLIAGNFILQNGKVHFEKIYQSPMSMKNLSEKLESLSNTSTGLQVKKTSEEAINGVIIRHQIDWTASGSKNKKIPDFLKLPVNANFVVEKNGSNYRVRVTDIWFSNVTKPGSQQHLKLENMIVVKNGLALSKNKKAMRALMIFDESLQELFRGKPSSF